MPLKLRPPGLGSGIDKNRQDYTMYGGGWPLAASAKPAAALNISKAGQPPEGDERLTGRANARAQRILGMPKPTSINPRADQAGRPA
jgi:hypothetical protein